MAGREFASYYRQPSLPRPATFAPRMPPNTSMRMVACSNPISSLPSQNSKFRDMTTFEPRMSFPTSTSTTPTLPLQPRLFHQANYNSMCYQNGYYWYQSLTEQRMVSTQYPSPGHTLPLETTSLRYPMQQYGMPLNIQPYPRPLPTLPIQDTEPTRPKSGTQIPPHEAFGDDLKNTIICEVTEEPLRKPLTAPHSLEHSPSHSGTYSAYVSLNRPPEYNPEYAPSATATHSEPYSLHDNFYPATFRDHESLCGWAELGPSGTLTYTGEPETLMPYSSEPETLQIAEEKCPKCGEFFTMRELKMHADGCLHTGETEIEIMSVDIVDSSRGTEFETPSAFLPVGRTEEVEECQNCYEKFQVSVLPEHFQECVRRNEGECPHCKELFLVTELPDHTEMRCEARPRITIPPPQKRALAVPPPVSRSTCDTCSLCYETVSVSEMETHRDECLKSQIVEYKDLNTKNWQRCLSCLCDFPPCEFKSHIKTCDDMLLGDIDRFKKFSPNLTDIDWASVALTREQRDAMDYVVKKAKTLSDQVDKVLFERILKLGFNKEDLECTLEWIKMDSPIIIHVFLDKLLPILINETRYKNQFETGTSHGSRDLVARSSWENNIFNNIYKNAEGPDRVKYGVLNIVGDIRGVKSCKQYGDSFFILRKVRLRTSFASADSSHASVKIASCEHYKHVLNEYSNNELTAVIQVATRKKRYANSDVIHHYKEVQIHGPIVLAEHIDCVVYHERHKGDKHFMELLENFRVKNNCNIVPMEMA